LVFASGARWQRRRPLELVKALAARGSVRLTLAAGAIRAYFVTMK
jgi:hypothetical protein